MKIKLKLPESNTYYPNRANLLKDLIRKNILFKLNAKAFRRYFLSHLPWFVSGISAFSKRKDMQHKMLYPEEIFYMKQYLDINGNSHRGFNSYKAKEPKAYVLIITNGKTVIGQDEVFTNDNKVIKEINSQLDAKARSLGRVVTSYAYKESGKKHRNLNLNNPKIIKGSVAIIRSVPDDNYYHFWVDTLSKYYLLNKSGIKPDYYMINDKIKFHKQIIKLLKINPKQIINFKNNTVISADKIIIPSAISNSKIYIIKKNIGPKYKVERQSLPSWLKGFYHNFQNPQAKPIHRIYISRSKGSRKILNEAPLIEILNKYKFKILHLEDLSVMEQIKTFNHASIIIAPHGAGLVNMSFSKKGTIILELYPQYYHDQSFRLHSNLLGHDYNYLIGCAKEAIKQNLSSGKKEYLMGLDFSVDVNRIEKLYVRAKKNNADIVQFSGEIFTQLQKKFWNVIL